MKNKWMKKVLVLMMCGALAVPAAGMAQPMVAQATSPWVGPLHQCPTPSPSASPDKTTESLKDAKTNMAGRSWTITTLHWSLPFRMIRNPRRRKR